MKKLVMVLVGLLIIALVAGCSLDKSADSLANGYYQSIQNKDYNKAASFLSANFLKKTSQADFVQILQNINNKLGDLQSYKLNSWNKNSQAGVGSAPSGTTYKLVYIVTYSKDVDTETITLFQPSGGELKIDGLSFNNASLLKP